MSRALRRAAWGVVDLSEHTEHYVHRNLGEGEPVPTDPNLLDVEVLR